MDLAGEEMDKEMIWQEGRSGEEGKLKRRGGDPGVKATELSPSTTVGNRRPSNRDETLNSNGREEEKTRRRSWRALGDEGTRPSAQTPVGRRLRARLA